MKKCLAYIVVALCILVSCSPKIIERIQVKTEYVTKEVRDSLYFRDSIYVKEKIKGDTVYVDKFVYKYIYKDKFRTDTLIREVHDTTQVEKLIEKNLTIGQQIKQNSFWWLVSVIILLLLWIFRKQIFRLW